MKLSKTEEQLMELIWKHEKIFLKELIEAHSDPKPAVTTVATLLKRMQDKNFVAYNLFGNSRQYYAIVKKEDYFTKHMKGIIESYFGNSAMQFASFFTKASKFTTKELEELKSIINNEIEKNKS
jgi:BlaI family transcriptional regulator, penicillinase repressor